MTSFASDVAPMFRTKDRMCMGPMGVDLTSYAYMSDSAGDGAFPDYANARHVLARITGVETPRMPKGGPYWGNDQVTILRNWIETGCAP